jgi:hypothetical protein
MPGPPSGIRAELARSDIREAGHNSQIVFLRLLSGLGISTLHWNADFPSFNGDSVHDFLRRLAVPITRRTLSVHGNQLVWLLPLKRRLQSGQGLHLLTLT